MAAKIVVPELGESVLEATVGHWLKKEGDSVSAGDVLVELETDKVDLEVGAEREGVLAQIARKEGENVRIGDVLGVIEEKTDAAGRAAAPAAAASTPHNGGPPVALQTEAGGAAAPAITPVEAPPLRSALEAATPSARRQAREQGIDLGSVPLAPQAQRLTRDSVHSLAAAPRTAVPPHAGPPAAAQPAAQPVSPVARTAAAQPFADNRREERLRMSRRRQTIARRLVEAQHTAAMLTTFNEVDMGAVMELRRRQKDAFKQRYGVGLGVVSFFVKATIAALRQFPRLNSEIDGDEMILKHYYDIGVAVGAEEGLVVPVLRDADRMGFAEIEIAIKDFAARSGAGTLTLADLRGGTFTISNGGVFGSLLSTPILNPPQSGILGLHKIQERPVNQNGQIVLRPMMYLALSYDHRMVDGLEAVQFLVRVKELVEDPGTLLIES
jgi:2-oxoglutarate dehydrogenase E2 component (dihydrolipoamide succinyltransferase)